MKPAAFEYVRPKSLAEAIAILSAAAGDAQILAGGQSLVAMMNLRVAAPDLLVDIARLDELRTVSETSDHVVLGACVTHAAIEDCLVPDPSRGFMPDVASNLAYRAVRTRGTLGGSLALSDPAADWPTVMSALAAQVLLRGPAGGRSVDAVDFATGVYETVRVRGRNHRKHPHPEAVSPRALGLCKILQEVRRVRQLHRRGGARPGSRLRARRARRRQWPADRSRAHVVTPPRRR